MKVDGTAIVKLSSTVVRDGLASFGGNIHASLEDGSVVRIGDGAVVSVSRSVVDMKRGEAGAGMTRYSMGRAPFCAPVTSAGATRTAVPSRGNPALWAGAQCEALVLAHHIVPHRYAVFHDATAHGGGASLGRGIYTIELRAADRSKCRRVMFH